MKLLTILIILIILILLLPGCDAIRDLTAKAIGAPTPDQINAVKQQVKEKDIELGDLAVLIHQSQAKQQLADESAQKLKIQSRLIRRQISAVSGQLAQAEDGPVFDALAQTVNQLQLQLKTTGNKAEEYSLLASRWRATVSELDGKLQGVQSALDRSWLELDGFSDQYATAIQNASNSVKVIGATASELGVPGAKVMGETASGVISSVLGLILGGGGIGVIAKRRGKKTKDEANGLKEVIWANEQSGIISNDPILRNKAKSMLTANAIKALAMAKGELKASAKMGAGS